MATTAAQPPVRPRLRVGALAVPRPGPELLFGAAIALVLSAIGLRGGGGVQLGPTTTVEMLLQLAGGALAAGAVLAHDGRRLHGLETIGAFAAFAALTALSILWAVEPSDAWLEANRTLAYLAVLTAGVVLAREAGAWWPALLGGILASCAIVSLYALGTKVFPAEDETFARLREPFSYWNAVGLVAAFGIPLSLWLGGRRHGHAALTALAHPLMGLFVLTMLLAYSRGALLAAAVGAGLWFALVPLRLRSAAVLATGALGGGLVATWAFAQDALSTDKVPLDLRQTAGTELALALVAMLVVLLGVGLGIGFLVARQPPGHETRKRAGAALLATLALLPVLFLGQLALSDKGVGGSLSEGWESLTDPDATTPANDPSRLTAVGSVRARYWDQAIKIFRDEPVLGAGAGGYPTARRRFREDELVVRHAHGRGVEVAAELGVLGIVTSILFLTVLALAVARATSLRRRWRAAPFTPERIGLLALTAVVATFLVHALVDWTWSIPGTAVPALLAAGWLAGRGRGDEPPAVPHGLRDRLRSGLRRAQLSIPAAAVVAFALLAALATWQPLRSVHAGDAAIDALDEAATPRAGVEKARGKAQDARDRNPLAVQPLFELATIEAVAGRLDAARDALEDAVRLQPNNPETWLRYAEFALRRQNDPQRAIDLLGPALYLDPRSDQAAALYLDATRRVNGSAGALPPAGIGTTPPASP
ncbi:MAG TPA: O-antigen ligase family protein [Baekduia sp.]|nr:O-antigen ligase family protein [Baekduia sp.]